MPLRIDRFPDTPAARAAAARFNERLRAGGMTEFEQAVSPFSKRYPDEQSRPVRQQYFLAIDEPVEATMMEVRGGYILQLQDYRVGDKLETAGFLKLPLSEGVVNSTYGPVGLHLVRDAMRRMPNLFCIGMGGLKRPLPQLMAKLGWFLQETPFYFRVLRPMRFLRHARILHRNGVQKLGCNILAWSGLGWIGAKIAQARHRRPQMDDIECSIEPRFGTWANEVWRRSAGHYAFCGARTSELLETLYPSDDLRWIRVLVRRREAPVGWALLLCTDLKGHKQFGDLRLGSIADCFASPDDAPLVIAAAVKELAARRPDLIVSSQLHAAWGAALRGAGFLRGPSNYVFAASPKLRTHLGLNEEILKRCHMNRGDGDGPINL